MERTISLDAANGNQTKNFSTYIPIPASVDETTLFQFMNDKALKFDQETEYRQYEDVPCFTFRHPRHGKQKNCSQ